MWNLNQMGVIRELQRRVTKLIPSLQSYIIIPKDYKASIYPVYLIAVIIWIWLWLTKFLNEDIATVDNEQEPYLIQWI